MLFKTLNKISTKGLLSLLAASLLLSACGTSSTSEEGNESKLYVSLTDAEGDFTQYTVDVDALKLYRSNGAVIETLPNTTTLDFSQYIDVTEFLTTATVPVGNYSKAEITLDFSNAELMVENEDGDAIPATAVDNVGDPLQTITLSALINSGEGFSIHYGQPASLTIDFDLEASNEVKIDPSGTSATVTVNPILVANTSIDDDKTRRARGLLTTVDLQEDSFKMDIRPFRIRLHKFGNITVNANDDTSYEIDGVGYSGDAGLSAMDALDILTPVVVLGEFNYSERRYLALEVYAGSSVPWHDRDAVKGSVIARNGNTLTVLGATVELDDGHFQFNDEISVLIDTSTQVTKQGSSEIMEIGDISIGQRVLVLGDMLDDETMDAASEGLVRMRYSDVSGLVDTVSPLQVDLQHINRRNIDRYDFSGTGIDPANDADPDHYEIDYGSLSLSGLQINAPVKVRGFPTAFGAAPLDFNAKTIIDVSLMPTHMLMSYGNDGSPTAVVTLDDTGLLLDLVSADQRHYLKQAGIVTDITDLASVPMIQPNDGFALYSIAQGTTVDVFTDWSRFQTTLSTLLSDGHQVILAHAKGSYDATELTLGSKHLVIRLTE